MVELALRKLYWQNMVDIATTVIRSCIQCAKANSSNKFKKFRELFPCSKGFRPFHTWSIESIPAIPEDKNGVSVLIIAVDCFSKWVEIGLI